MLTILSDITVTVRHLLMFTLTYISFGVRDHIFFCLLNLENVNALHVIFGIVTYYILRWLLGCADVH